jgi:hypothetical protein
VIVGLIGSNTKSLQMFNDIKEQVNVVSGCKERCFLPDFCVVVIELIVGILVSDQLQLLALLLFIKLLFWSSLSSTSDLHAIVSVIISLSSFLLSFIMCLFIDNSLSSFELGYCLFFGAVFSLHPRMCKNVV